MNEAGTVLGSGKSKMTNISWPPGTHRLVGHVSYAACNQLVKIPSKNVTCMGVGSAQRNINIVIAINA